MHGKRVCQTHGGKSLAGIASPTFKTGRYSKVIPTHLAAQYQAAQSDPDLLGIKEDIALQDALLRGALEAMSAGEAGELWAKLKEAWQQYQAAKHGRKTKNADDDGPSEGEALAMVGFLIQEGYHDYMARIELRQMIQERSKLVEAEGKRLERAHQTITATQAMTLAQALLQSVLAHVSDRATLNNIQNDFVRIVGIADSGGAAALRNRD